MSNTADPEDLKQSGASAGSAAGYSDHDGVGELGDLRSHCSTHGCHLTPTVGIGGSTGAISALQALFNATPPDTGMVFLVNTSWPRRSRDVAAVATRKPLQLDAAAKSS